MNILSLFDGMSCGQIALHRAGIDVDNYYASEVDKYAIDVTMANYPDTVQLGDVTKWRDWDIDWASIDLLIGGSPCQGFSFAGKQLAFDDPRSALFFEYLNILNHIKSVNPNVKFLLENVRMKKEYLSVISSMLKVGPVFINSALVGAQNRQRYYWANWEFMAPNDKGVNIDFLLNYPPALINITSRMKNIRGSCALIKAFHKNVRSIDQKHKTLTATGMRPSISGGCNIKIDDQWFMVSPLGAEKLQTVPDNYTNHVSNTQRYKMLGNGWTVDVIAHIFRSSGLTGNKKRTLKLNDCLLG